MSRDLLTYGITTSSSTPGASAFTSYPQNAFIVGRFLYSGQTLGYYTGGTAAAATLQAALVPIPVQGIYISGPAPLTVSGPNPIYVTTFLTQGYGYTLGY